jgi:phenylacetate-CoA ligase
LASLRAGQFFIATNFASTYIPKMIEYPQRMAAEKPKPAILIRDRYLQLAKASVAENEKIIMTDFRRLLAHASQNNPWWKRRISQEFAGVNAAPSMELMLSCIPIMTRAEVQEHGPKMEILPTKHDPKHFPRFRTSGSTGRPIVGLRYAPVNSSIQAALILIEWNWFNRKADAKMGELRLHKEDTDRKPTGVPLSYLGTGGYRWIRDSAKHTIGEMLEFLEQVQPDYVFANGVTSRLIAQKAIAENRQFKVDQWMVVSDRVDESFRQIMKEAFDTRIVDRYSAEELGLIALQCPSADHLHVVEPTVYMEIVDANDQPVKPGESGRVILTGLHSLAMPLIRYEIGDYATWETEKCPAGIKWRAIKSIDGRIRDFIFDKNGEQHIVTFVGAVWLGWRKVRDAHAVRFNDKVVFLVDNMSEFTDSETALVKSALQSIFHTEDEVEVFQNLDLSQLPSTKRRDFTKFEVDMPNPLDPERLLVDIVTEAKKRISIA